MREERALENNTEQEQQQNPEPPKWCRRLYRAIRKSWQIHGHGRQIGFSISYHEHERTWIAFAMPVFQQVYGGEADGRTCWSGFVFDIEQFADMPGVVIQAHAAGSYCNQCRPYPELMMKIKFAGRPVLLHILLEPADNSPIIEIIDTVAQVIRPNITGAEPLTDEQQ
jgi:hypothetical protein